MTAGVKAAIQNQSEVESGSDQKDTNWGVGLLPFGHTFLESRPYFPSLLFFFFVPHKSSPTVTWPFV